jgi:hypothetical protein
VAHNVGVLAATQKIEINHTQKHHGIQQNPDPKKRGSSKFKSKKKAASTRAGPCH